MRNFIKTHRVLAASLGIGILFLAVYARVFYYVPKLKPGEKKIGIVTTSTSFYQSHLFVYDQNLKLQRTKKMRFAGLGANFGRCPVVNGQLFLETTGIVSSKWNRIWDFPVIDLEKETICKYPVSHNTRLSAVAANSKYAYTISDFNFILTQHRLSDQKEILKIKLPDGHLELAAANENFLFLGFSSFGEGNLPPVQSMLILNAHSLDQLAELRIPTEKYGSFFRNEYLLTDEALYLPLPLSPEKPKPEKEPEQEKVQSLFPASDKKDEIYVYNPREIENSLNNKILKIYLKDFSYSVIELARKAPRKIEKKGDLLFVIHEDSFYSDSYLTVYNEITGKQSIRTLKDLCFLNLMLSGDELYLIGTDNNTNYQYIYQYTMSDDCQFTLKKKQRLNVDRREYITSVYSYEK